MSKQRTRSEEEAFRHKIEDRWGGWRQEGRRGPIMRENTHSKLGISTGDTMNCLGYAIGLADVLPYTFDEARDIAFTNDRILTQIDGSYEDMVTAGEYLEGHDRNVDWPDDDDLARLLDGDEDDENFDSSAVADALRHAVDTAHASWHDENFEFFDKVRVIGTIGPGFTNPDNEDRPLFSRQMQALAAFGITVDEGAPGELHYDRLDRSIRTQLSSFFSDIPPDVADGDPRFEAAVARAYELMHEKMGHIYSDELQGDGLIEASASEAEAIMAGERALGEGETLIYVCHDGGYDYHAIRYHPDDALWSQKVGLSGPVASGDNTRDGPLIEDPRDLLNSEGWSWKHPVGFFIVPRAAVDDYARKCAARIGLELPEEPGDGPSGPRPVPRRNNG